MTRSLRTRLHVTVIRTLKDERSSKGLTQKQLAEKLRRPQSFVAKIEPGERRQNVNDVHRMDGGTRIPSG